MGSAVTNVVECQLSTANRRVAPVGRREAPVGGREAPVGRREAPVGRGGHTMSARGGRQRVVKRRRMWGRFAGA